MAGGIRYSCFLTYSALLLIGVYDVEASSCQRVIHKKVGDTVEFSSCLPTEGVTMARWKYKGSIIADKDPVSGEHQFKGRLDLNPTNFSLTVRRLTLKDSGDFSFLSEVGDSQRETVPFTLKVHEPITVRIVSNSTWHTLNKSCTVLLECQATSDISNSGITYKWAVRNQTIEGPRLEYTIKPQDEDTKFTCTISNEVSKMTATETETCRNITSDIPEIASNSSSLVPLIVGLVIVILLIFLLLLSLLFYTKSDTKDPCCNRATQSQTVNQDETQQPVYSSLLHGDGCVYEALRGSKDAGTGDGCVYEVMRGSEDAGTGGPPNQYSNHIAISFSQRS
ncbi:SLAM family member 5 isoform X2 [Perca flavescens]|uniref:SLAM family member 5 isoform X2 n=1 Tax=Perca flavescens TaxID=8167 RepID=UPI00106EEACB|nr:SLAM family member 5-like isoform X2 [Perca flavescens]